MISSDKFVCNKARGLSIVAQNADSQVGKVLAQVEKSMVRKDQELSRANKALTTLHSGHHDLKQQYASLQSEYALAMSRLAEELSELQSRYESQIASRDSKLEAQSKAINDLSAQTESLKRELELSQSVATSVESRLRASEEKCAAQSTQISASEKEYDRLTISVTELEGENIKLCTLLESALGREKSSVFKSKDMKEDQLSKLVSDKNELLAMNTQLRKEFASLTSDLELALDHRLAKGAEEIAKYKQLCDNLQTELETVKHNNLNLKREFDEKTERIMNKHLSEMDGLDKQHSEELSVLRNQLMDLDNSVDQLKPLQDKLTEKQSLLSLKESVIRDLMEQIETLKFKHDEGKIEKLEHERQSLIADLQASREALAEKDTVIQYVSSELETIKAELEIKNEKRVNEIQEQLKQAVEAIRILESQLDSQIETNHNLNTQLGKLEIEKENLYTLSRQRMHKLSAVVAALSDD